jgi:hypothetical protein
MTREDELRVFPMISLLSASTGRDGTSPGGRADASRVRWVIKPTEESGRRCAFNNPENPESIIVAARPAIRPFISRGLQFRNCLSTLERIFLIDASIPRSASPTGATHRHRHRRPRCSFNGFAIPSSGDSCHRF